MAKKTGDTLGLKPAGKQVQKDITGAAVLKQTTPAAILEAAETYYKARQGVAMAREAADRAADALMVTLARHDAQFAIVTNLDGDRRRVSVKVGAERIKDEPIND